MGSDDVLLREIDACVSVWSRQCGQALLSGSIDDYYTQKNQVRSVVILLLRSSFTSLRGHCVYRSLHFKNGEEESKLTRIINSLQHVSRQLSSSKVIYLAFSSI